MFEQQNHSRFTQYTRGRKQLLIHGRTIRRLIFEAPKIKAAYAVGLEHFRQLDAAFENFVLLLEGKVRAELRDFWTEFRFWRTGPIHFEERAADIGHS